jgi:hypothetical protein
LGQFFGIVFFLFSFLFGLEVLFEDDFSHEVVQVSNSFVPEEFFEALVGKAFHEKVVCFTDVFVEASEDFGGNVFDFGPELEVINGLRPQVIVADFRFAFGVFVFLEVVEDEGVGFFVEFETELGDELGGSKLEKKYTFCSTMSSNSLEMRL